MLSLAALATGLWFDSHSNCRFTIALIVCVVEIFPWIASSGLESNKHGFVIG
jgi:hypothetical protein